MAVSATLSPLAAELLWASEKPKTLPPSSYMAASKLSRVRVEGSKNRVASFRPRHFSLYFLGFSMMSLAVAMSSSSSSTDRSRMLMTLLFILYLQSSSRPRGCPGRK